MAKHERLKYGSLTWFHKMQKNECIRRHSEPKLSPEIKKTMLTHFQIDPLDFTEIWMRIQIFSGWLIENACKVIAIFQPLKRSWSGTISGCPHVNSMHLTVTSWHWSLSLLPEDWLILFIWWPFPLIWQWICARLQYLQYISNVLTAILH